MKPRPARSARLRHRLMGQRLLPDLAAIRATLLEESRRLRRNRRRRRGREPEHLCCRRPNNQMRISPLEARAIAQAFRNEPELRAKLPRVLERLATEIPLLRDDSERQSFDCPLLEGDRCLVHHFAKPIGCLAWNPGRDYSRNAWRAFEARDRLNDSVYGKNWQLRVIPLWLKRAFRHRLRPRPSSPRTGDDDAPHSGEAGAP